MRLQFTICGCQSVHLGPAPTCTECCSSPFDSCEETTTTTLVLASLHWLPVRFRIKFKILLLTYKTPDNLSDLLQLYTPSRALRSSDHLLLTLHKSRMVHRGDRAFAVVATKMWNDLPLHIRKAPTVSLFKLHLKTYFFTLAFETV